MSGRRRVQEASSPRGGARRPADPFRVLGLAAAAELTDDDVRNAWRRIAAATHPDRADGGDPARFAEAAAAYTDLRTAFGRGEARAGLAASAGPPASGMLRRLAAAVKAGRPGRLALRAAGVAGAVVVAVAVAGRGAAGPALAVGAVTWLVLTGRRDLSLGGRPHDHGLPSGASPESRP